jgi:hypothetical protein
VLVHGNLSGISFLCGDSNLWRVDSDLHRFINMSRIDDMRWCFDMRTAGPDTGDLCVMRRSAHLRPVGVV